MFRRLHPWILPVGLFALTGPATRMSAVRADAIGTAPGLAWDASTQRLSANIDGWSLPKTLTRLSRITGWEVRIEPGADRRIATKFRLLDANDALPRLLGDLNFAVLPRSNSAPQLLIYRTSAAQATEVVPAAGKIGDELLLTLKPGDPSRIDAIARQYGGKIIGRSDALNTYRLKFDSDAAADLAREALKLNDELAGIENNIRYDRPDFSEAATEAIVPALNLKPKGVPAKDQLIVALIDTGTQKVGPPYDGFVLPSVKLESAAVVDDNGSLSHGTGMLLTLLNGLGYTQHEGESKVRVLPINVFNSAETTTSFDVALGINEAWARGATAFNLSLGTPDPSPLLDNLMHQIHDKGGMFISAAGNTPTAQPSFPAGSPWGISVTASQGPGVLSSFANFAPTTDLMASGRSVVTWNGQRWLVTGTSPAAASVSGISAGLLSRGWTPQMVEVDLKKNLPFTPSGN